MLIAASACAQSPPYYRLRYHPGHWQVFHTTAFHIYFPKGDDSLCAFVARELPGAQLRVKSAMGTESAKTPNIIIYPSVNRLYESNIGSNLQATYTLPTFVSRGNRLLLFFTGDYPDLKRQLSIALARSAWESAFISDLGAQLRGTGGQSPDAWFSEGAISLLGEGWPLQNEETLRRLFRNDTTGFGEIINASPALAGQAFCYYLNHHFREDAVRQVFFQLRKRKSLPAALRLITKRDAGMLYDSCYRFYVRRFADVHGQDDKPAPQLSVQKVALPAGRLLQVLVSPLKTPLALLIARGNTRSLYLCDLSHGRHNRIAYYQLPPWLQVSAADQYPLFRWAADGLQLLVVMPHKGTLTLRQYALSGDLVRSYELPVISGVSSFRPSHNGALLLAAWLKGQSDLVDYAQDKKNYHALTSDYLDDKDPVVPQNGKSVYFVSARPQDKPGSDTLPLQKGIYEAEAGLITPIATDTPGYIFWRTPVTLNDRRLLATTSRGGRERYALITPAAAHSSIQLLDTAGNFQYLPGPSEIMAWQQQADSLQLSFEPAAAWISRHLSVGDRTLVSPWLKDYVASTEARRLEDSLVRKAVIDGGPSFLDGVLNRGNSAAKTQQHRDSINAALRYQAKKVKPYVLQLYSAYFSAKVSNDYFASRYQPYLNDQGTFKIPDVGGMIQGGLSDLFEDHQINIAYRLPAGSEGSSFSIRYRNTQKRLEWGLAYLRDVSTLKPDPLRQWVDDDGRPYPNLAKLKTHYYELSLQYPLSYYSAVGGSLAARKDRTVFLATENYSLQFPPIRSVWGMLSVYYNINKLRPTLPALYRGWNLRLGADAFAGFSGKSNALGAVSLDAAWHKPLYRYITLAVQGHAAISGGNQYLLYNLGGVENNLTQRIDSTVHFSQSAPYAFQRLVTPFRGYLQNSLYGSRYALLNADIYFPLFATLIPVTTNFSAINHLQIGLFSDAAGAEEHFTHTAGAGKWLASFGYSVRTTLAGYPLRFDMGWPATGGKPVWYLSLAL